MTPSQDMSMQSMSSMKVHPPISTYTPLVQIIISKPDTQQTLNNTSDIQIDPLVNPPNIAIHDIRDITLELGVGLHTIINTNALQVADPNPSNLKIARSEKSIEGDSNSDHAPISQYLQHPRPPIPQVLVGSRLVIMAASMNHLLPPIEDSFTCQVT